MKFYTYRPTFPLCRYVEFFWYCQDYVLEHRWERIVPTLQAQLLVNIGEDELRWRTEDGCTHRCTGAGFSAESYRTIDIDTRQQAHIMGALFLPGGASVFSPHPANQTLDQHLDLVDFLPGQLALRERLMEETTVLQRFLLLEGLLRARLHTNGGMNKDPVPAVLSMLEAGASVKDTAESLGFTYRSLNRLCRGRLGSTPKKAARLLRFRKALGRIEEVACRGWSEFALDFGFADQAHLIREFQRFSTFTPSELLSMGPGTLHHIPLPE